MRLLLCLLLFSAWPLLAEEAVLPPIETAVEAKDWNAVKRLALLALSADLSAEERSRVEQLLAQASEAMTAVGSDKPVANETGKSRQLVLDMMHVQRPSDEQWQALDALRKTMPDDELIARVDMRFRPSWAASAGRDSFGQWSTVRLGRVLVRFRFVGQGTLALLDGRVLANRKDMWVAETETTNTMRGSLIGGFASAHKEQLPAVDLMPEQILHDLRLLAEKLPPTCLARLPSPEEWEYAARAGLLVPRLPHVRGYASAAIDGLAPVPVASFTPNAWGLFDIHGNAWELVQDHVGQLWRCGGGWRTSLAHCRLDSFYPVSTWRKDPTLGYRLVLEDRQ